MLQFVKAHKKLFLYALASVVVAVAVILYGFSVRNYIAVGLGCLLAVVAYALVVAPMDENLLDN